MDIFPGCLIIFPLNQLCQINRGNNESKSLPYAYPFHLYKNNQLNQFQNYLATVLGKYHTYLQIDKRVNLYFLNWRSLVKDLLCPSRCIWLSSYLLADALVALLLPLPMLLTNCLLTASECMSNTIVLKGVDTPSQVRKKICSLLCMSTGEAPACQSAFSVANS